MKFVYENGLKERGIAAVAKRSLQMQTNETDPTRSVQRPIQISKLYYLRLVAKQDRVPTCIPLMFTLFSKTNYTLHRLFGRSKEKITLIWFADTNLADDRATNDVQSSASWNTAWQMSVRELIRVWVPFASGHCTYVKAGITILRLLESFDRFLSRRGKSSNSP